VTTDIDAITCAVFLLVAFSLAGGCQAIWLASSASRRFDIPLDGSRLWRGRRIFGEHKTARGFVVMVPATAGSFVLLAAAAATMFQREGLWPLSIPAYGALGAWAGLGFMLGELPNSFVKRQLGIAPGAAATGRLRGALFYALDRCDSVVGAMLALTVVADVPLATWLVVAAMGPVIHGGFSALVFQLGGKARIA
jgi:CDP-2,3-bis-(O-geranylgeranyl)-sn-glycerol synthase